MRDAIDDLLAYGRANGKKQLVLDIRKKPTVDTAVLEQQLDQFILSKGLPATDPQITVIISDYEFVPKL